MGNKSIKEKEASLWEYLKSEGIFTREQFNEKLKTMSKINIACFVNPTQGVKL